MTVLGSFLLTKPAFAIYETWQEAFSSIFSFAIDFAGVILIIVFLVGGFMYLLSAGNDETANRAKKILLYGVIGLVIIVMSYSTAKFFAGNLGLSISVFPAVKSGNTSSSTTNSIKKIGKIDSQQITKIIADSISNFDPTKLSQISAGSAVIINSGLASGASNVIISESLRNYFNGLELTPEEVVAINKKIDEIVSIEPNEYYEVDYLGDDEITEEDQYWQEEDSGLEFLGVGSAVGMDDFLGSLDSEPIDWDESNLDDLF